MKQTSHLKSLAKGLAIALAMALVCGVAAFSFSSCKAWRTITTTATYEQKNDTAKTTTTISSKTVEEYTGVRKK